MATGDRPWSRVWTIGPVPASHRIDWPWRPAPGTWGRALAARHSEVALRKICKVEWYPYISFHCLQKEKPAEVTKYLYLSAICSVSVAHGGKQMPQFVLDFVGRSHRSTDLRAQQFPITPAQAVHGDLDRSFTGVAPDGQLSVGNRAFAAGETILELLEQCQFAGCNVFLAQIRQRFFQERERPTAVEQFFRREHVDRLDPGSRLRPL